MPCNCRASSCPECMGDYRPSEQPFESAYRSALVRIKQAEARAEKAEAELAALKAQPAPSVEEAKAAVARARESVMDAGDKLTSIWDATKANGWQQLDEAVDVLIDAAIAQGCAESHASPETPAALPEDRSTPQEPTK